MAPPVAAHRNESHTEHATIKTLKMKWLSELKIAPSWNPGLCGRITLGVVGDLCFGILLFTAFIGKTKTIMRKLSKIKNRGWIVTDATSTHTDTQGKNFLYSRNKLNGNLHIKPLFRRKLLIFKGCSIRYQSRETPLPIQELPAGNGHHAPPHAPLFFFDPRV